MFSILPYLTTPWPAAAVYCLLLAGICKFIIYPAFFSPLARIPNAHWTCSFSSAWILWTRYNWHENREVHAAHQKHGPIIRLGPNEISVNQVDGGIRTVYGGGFEKGEWYRIFDNYGVPCMFSTFHSRPHSVLKRMISNIYSKSVILSSSAIASQAKIILHSRLLPVITASTDPRHIPLGIDVFDLWNATSMDFTTAYQFGISNSSNFLQDAAYRQHWLELYQSRKKYTFFPQELPKLTKFMHAIGVRLVPRWVDYANQELEASCLRMCKAATEFSATRKSFADNPADEPVVLNALMAGIAKEQKLRGSDSVLRDTTLKEPELSIASEMIDNLGAGHETSAITMTYLTWHMSYDTALQDTLRAELLTLNPPIKYLPTITDAPPLPSPKQLDALPLLHAIVMETLRVNASIPGGQPRVTPSPSCTLAGYEIPGGVRIGAAAWSLHRNAKVFPYPDIWDHTRWLDQSGQRGGCPGDEKEKSMKERDRWFWAFSSGGRMCIGSNFAMHELKLIAAAVYTNFRTHIVNDDGIEQVDGYVCGPRSNRLILRFEKI